MTTMIPEVYDAFRSAGVPEEKARKAAEAMSSEATATKGDIVKLDKEIAAVRADISLLKWMVGVVMAGVATQILKGFFTRLSAPIPTRSERLNHIGRQANG